MPPPTESSSNVVILALSWAWSNIMQIGAILGGSGILISGIFRLGKRKKEYEALQSTVEKVEKNQEKIIGLIPKSSWEDGVMLVNAVDCSKMRVDCRTRVIVEEYREDLSVLKEAVGWMIRHDKNIPDDKSDELFNKLMK